jgi:hypothetical protein
MVTDDFFRPRLDQMINLQHQLAVLAGKICPGIKVSRPWRKWLLRAIIRLGFSALTFLYALVRELIESTQRLDVLMNHDAPEFKLVKI